MPDVDKGALEGRMEISPNGQGQMAGNIQNSREYSEGTIIC